MMTKVSLTMTNDHEFALDTDPAYTRLISAYMPTHHDKEELIRSIRELAKDVKAKGGKLTYYGTIARINDIWYNYEFDYAHYKHLFHKILGMSEQFDGNDFEVSDIDDKNTPMGSMKALEEEMHGLNWRNKPISIINELVRTVRIIQDHVDNDHVTNSSLYRIA
jgi:hypothetical protein